MKMLFGHLHPLQCKVILPLDIAGGGKIVFYAGTFLKILRIKHGHPYIHCLLPFVFLDMEIGVIPLL